MKIIHEKSKCIGCGACISLCSESFEMGDDGKANLKNSKETDKRAEKYELEVSEVGCAKEAADNCPVQCIHIE